MDFEPEFVIENQSGSGGGRAITTPDCVTIVTCKGGNGRTQLTVRIGENVMKRMRWISGDKIAIVYGNVGRNKALLLRRASDGFTLSSQQGNKSKGQCVRSSLKITLNGKYDEFVKDFIGKNFKPQYSGDAVIISST